VIATLARFVRANYFLPFFVVFLAEDFLVVDFLEPFLAAMALGTSFLEAKCKAGRIFGQRFFACVPFFFRAAARRDSRAPRAVCARTITRQRACASLCARRARA